MSIIYHENDANLGVLSSKTVGIIGYGNLGRPVARNLRDSGIRLLIGLREDETRDHAREDGFEPQDIQQVIPRSHILLLMLPDEVLPEVYLEAISPALQRGHLLVFASGYNIAFGFVEPPPFIDVGMIAPRTIGAAVRTRYLDGSGFVSFVGVGQDATGTTWESLLALAKAMGSLKAGAIEISMVLEAQLDLFVQQAILPAFHHVMTTAVQVLLEDGYPAEAVMTDLILSGEFSDYLSRVEQGGLLHAMRLSSLTGQYGIFSRLSRFKELKLEGLMEATLADIRSGDFSKEWAREYEAGYPSLGALLRAQEDDDLLALEQQTLGLLRGK
ncbi:MAG: NAD(P)-binding domain-containing protein [Chloroflexota bacterium]|nr:NAD(P)-binding domain-containing protein [Chloroflexota bacterium]